MSAVQDLWVGYNQSGGRARLDFHGKNKTVLLGSRASEISTIMAVSAREANAKPILLDFDGSLADRLSGYFDTFDYRAFLYDVFRLDPPEAWHAQMAAAAYTAALDLSSEEEAIINSAVQQLASQSSMVSPVSIFDVMGKVEGFRGFYVDKLKGRIGSLRLFDAVDDQPFERLVTGNVIVDFHRAPYPQAAELALCLFLAKLLARNHANGPTERILVVTEVHRLFRSVPRPLHGSRLLTQLLESPVRAFLSSDQHQALNPQLLQGCQVRVYSSDAWHSLYDRSARILPGSFVIEDRSTGHTLAFVPRRVASKTADYVTACPRGGASPQLTMTILEHIGSYPLSTRESVAQYLSPEFLPSDINEELDRLHSRGCLLVEPKDSGPGPAIFAYTLTEAGRTLMKGSKS